MIALKLSKNLNFVPKLRATIGRPYTKYRNIANCRGEHCSPLNRICLFIQTEADENIRFLLYFLTVEQVCCFKGCINQSSSSS